MGSIFIWILVLAALSYGWAKYSMRSIRVDDSLAHNRHKKRGRIVLYKTGAKHYSSKFSSSSSE